MENWIAKVFLFTPGFCCLFWAAVLIIFGKRKSPQTVLLILSILASIRMFLDSALVTIEPYSIEATYLDLISDFTTFLVYPAIAIYILTLRGKTISPILALASTLPAILFGTASLVITKIMGVENSSRFLTEMIMNGETTLTGAVYDVSANIMAKLFYVLVCIGILSCIAYSVHTLLHNDYKFGDLTRMYTMKGEISSINLICVMLLTIIAIAIVEMLIPWSFYRSHIWVADIFTAIVTVILFISFYVGTFFMGRKVTIDELRRPGDPICRPDNFLNLESGEELIRKVSDESRNGLLEKFRSYIENDRKYLDPDISIENVTSALGTNRTYISVMMKSELHMPFRTYINTLRIEEVKRYLLANPDDILDSVAMKCGFASDSQLVKKFKEIEGMTPREWLSKQDR